MSREIVFSEGIATDAYCDIHFSGCKGTPCLKYRSLKNVGYNVCHSCMKKLFEDYKKWGLHGYPEDYDYSQWYDPISGKMRKTT